VNGVRGGEIPGPDLWALAETEQGQYWRYNSMDIMDADISEIYGVNWVFGLVFSGIIVLLVLFSV
jgi:hypothetical protein